MTDPLTHPSSRLLARMHSMGIRSTAELASRLGRPGWGSRIDDILSNRLSAQRDDGQWREVVFDICDVLDERPEQLFGTSELDELTDVASAYLSDVPEKRVEHDEALLGKQLGCVMTNLLTRLTPREERVLRLRFGFGCEEHSCEEIGVLLMISRDRVRKLEMTALRKLRQPKHKRDLIPFC